MPSVPHRTISINDAVYPTLLREIPDAPERFFLRGELPPAGMPCVAVVGTRKATSAGKDAARDIATGLAMRGCAIVSGLALGIDAAAHEGALSAGGTTLAILGNGIDTVYPASHEALAARILKNGGGILSEYPPGTPAYPSQFLARNRIVSGFATATVIVEAPRRSGTLVTAKHALDQGREVFVLPGPATHPNFRGSHELIRTGARLVRNADDILEDLASSSSEFAVLAEHSTYEPSDEVENAIFSALREARGGLSIDELIAATKLEPPAISQRLTFLTLEGILEESRGAFKLKHPSS